MSEKNRKSEDKSEDKSYYRNILCQSHAGNLYQHVQWATLQVIQWHMMQNEIMDGFHDLENLNLCIVSTFFHDIGKAGDCIKSCNQVECWYDMYNTTKYGGLGDNEHPTRSGDIILGKELFQMACDKCQKNCVLDIRHMINQYFPEVDIPSVALAAYMHWEFGKINISRPGQSYQDRINFYIDRFISFCHICQLTPNLFLLKLCIVVACADITAGTNVRLLPSVNKIKPCSRNYLGKDPWVLFGMDQKYLDYRKDVLNNFKLRKI